MEALTMPISRDALVTALRWRYDYYSSRAVLGDLLGQAGLEDKDSFSDKEIEQLCEVLKEEGGHEAVIDALRAEIGLPPLYSGDDADDDDPSDDEETRKKKAEAKKKKAEEAKKKAEEAKKKAEEEA